MWRESPPGWLRNGLTGIYGYPVAQYLNGVRCTMVGKVGMHRVGFNQEWWLGGATITCHRPYPVPGPMDRRRKEWMFDGTTKFH